MQKTNSVEGLKCDLEKLQRLTDALVPDLSQINFRSSKNTGALL